MAILVNVFPFIGNLVLVLSIVLGILSLPTNGVRHHLRKNSHVSKAPIMAPNSQMHREEEFNNINGVGSKNNAAVSSLPKNHIVANDYGLPRFAEVVSNTTVVLGRDVILPCVIDNLHKYKVAWVRVDSHTILTIHNKVITRNYRISLAQAEGRHWVLRISNVHESDRGWYMCQINTDPMRSQMAYVEVVVPPDIVDSESSSDTVVREGSNVTLTCKAKGYPAPHVLWRREDGAPINQGSYKHHSYDGESLLLTRVSRLHMGAYLCIASNRVPPSVSKRIMLSVQFSPMIWIPHQLEGTTVGQDITLQCRNEAFPPPIMYWTNERDDMIVQGEKFVMVNTVENEYKNTMSLTIRNVSGPDFRGYRCVVRNSMGETDGLIRLYEYSIPTKAPKSTVAITQENFIPLRNYPNKHDESSSRKGSLSTTVNPVLPRSSSGIISSSWIMISLTIMISISNY